jgi:hypothetical protein
MALSNRMFLRPGPLWLTLNLTLSIQCLSPNNIYIYYICIPRKMFSPTPYEVVPPGIHVPQVADNCSIHLFGSRSKTRTLGLLSCDSEHEVS